MELNSKSVTVAATALLPVTLAEAKKQVELSSDDDRHDDHLRRLIAFAMETVEHDAQQLLVDRTVTEKFAYWPDEYYLCLRWSPIQSVTSIYYRDSAGTNTLWASSNYSLDAERRRIWLAPTITWPTSLQVDRWDAVTITYVAGHTVTPALLKQAMLLQIAHGFEGRDMMDNAMIHNKKAYDDLIYRALRGTYP